MGQHATRSNGSGEAPPGSPRRRGRMFTVALIGPDGAGKTTVARRLEQSLPMPVKYLYMGVSADSSNHQLPTTRLIVRIRRALGAPPDTGGPADPARQKRRAVGWKRPLAAAKSGLRLVNLVAEEWYRQLLAWQHVRRGVLVIFDRHFYSDYHAYDIAATSRPTLSRRIHGALLAHAYPQPDLVVYLDAPPELLHARKGEGTIALLERRRQDYLALAESVRHFAVVDASRSADEVTAEVARLIQDFGHR